MSIIRHTTTIEKDDRNLCLHLHERVVLILDLNHSYTGAAEHLWNSLWLCMPYKSTLPIDIDVASAKLFCANQRTQFRSIRCSMRDGSEEYIATENRMLQYL